MLKKHLGISRMLPTMVIRLQKTDKKLYKKYKILTAMLDLLLAHHRQVVMVLHLLKLTQWFIIQMVIYI